MHQLFLPVTWVLDMGRYPGMIRYQCFINTLSFTEWKTMGSFFNVQGNNRLDRLTFIKFWFIQKNYRIQLEISLYRYRFQLFREYGIYIYIWYQYRCQCISKPTCPYHSTATYQIPSPAQKRHAWSQSAHFPSTQATQTGNPAGCRSPAV